MKVADISRNDLFKERFSSDSEATDTQRTSPISPLSAPLSPAHICKKGYCTCLEPATLASSVSDMEGPWRFYCAASRAPSSDFFIDNLNRCATAMEAGINPVLIPSGSSGSYFIRDINEKIIAVFKPKDEEPFAPLNPKWPKVLQRLLCFCCFGRACLIPNNGYLSETGASLIDEYLQLNVVPRTRVVKLASSSFHYTRSCWKRVEARPKVGSYQLFVDDYVSAGDLVPEWSREGKACPLSKDETVRFTFLFQKMCILDYVIRNTDRHLENWLIKYKPNETLEIAAIDNGLAFPVKHPETSSRLRQFPFGWAHLYWAKLPWDDGLRERLVFQLTPQFVVLLCKQVQSLFKFDSDSSHFLIRNQLRVLRGQIWNLRTALLRGYPPADMVRLPPVRVSRRHLRPVTDDWERTFSVRHVYRKNWCC